MRRSFQKWVWVLPAAALVGGLMALSPGVLASAAAPAAPAVSGAGPTALVRPTAADRAVLDGRDWQVMAVKGSNRGPK